MSTPSTDPRTLITTGNVEDPLAPYRSRPVVSSAPSSSATYLGRVVIELWTQEGISDANNLAIALDIPSGIESRAFLQRVADALQARIPRLPEAPQQEPQ